MLDGAWVPGLVERLHAEPSLRWRACSAETLAPDMKQVAPYLVKLEPESEFADSVVGTAGAGTGNLRDLAPRFRALRNHLRQLTLIYRRDGTPLSSATTTRA